MRKILTLEPTVLTITIRPKLDGTAQVEAKATPENADLLALSQAMLGLVANYLLKIQSAQHMLVGQTPPAGEEGEGNAT